MDVGFPRYRRGGGALGLLARHSSATRGLAAMRRVVLLAAVAGLPGFADRLTCAPGTGTPMLVAQLYFGLAIGGRSDVTDREWAGFVDEVIAPALPDGFTVLDGNGAWMNPATRLTSRERTKVVIVAVSDTPERIAALNTVREAYQRAFRQQLVGMTAVRECATF